MKFSVSIITNMKEELEALLVDIDQRSFDSADAVEAFRVSTWEDRKE